MQTFRITGTVVGIGERKHGVSKSGYAYDFTELSVVYKQTGTNGNYAHTFKIDTPLYDGKVFAPGDGVELFGVVVKFNPIVNYMIHHPKH